MGDECERELPQNFSSPTQLCPCLPCCLHPAHQICAFLDFGFFSAQPLCESKYTNLQVLCRPIWRTVWKLSRKRRAKKGDDEDFCEKNLVLKLDQRGEDDGIGLFMTVTKWIYDLEMTNNPGGWGWPGCARVSPSLRSIRSISSSTSPALSYLICN